MAVRHKQIKGLDIFNYYPTKENNMNPIEPEYYGKPGTQPIDLIDSQNLPFNRGNVIKYVTRAGKKSKDTEIQDLQKAQYYLNREITRLVRQKELDKG